MSLVSVFTPTYNRGKLLETLFNSLCHQTTHTFEWIIVDDGSSDNTAEVVKKLSSGAPFKVKYFYQTNRGKHIAINRGIQEASGKFFFIVDSDDYLPANSIERVLYHFNSIQNRPNIAGVCGMRHYPDGRRIGGNINFTILETYLKDFRYKYKVKGDLAEVFYTEILRKYPFPQVEEEKFCPEALIWYRISQNYKIHFFNENIYFCNYLEGGLTANSVKLRRESPITSMRYYAERSKFNLPVIYSIKNYINYWRFGFCTNMSLKNKLNQIKITGILFLPAGYIFHLIDNKRLK